MKIYRFKHNNEINYGIEEDNKLVQITGDIFNDYKKTDIKYDFDDIEILVPVEPSKILAVGKNYLAHAKEFDSVVPDEPCIFMKPNSAIIGHNDKIIYPDFVDRVDFEGELAIVIKKDGKNISRENAMEYILGYTILNDVTARNIQKSDEQWFRAKGMDTFAPIGPCISTDIDASNLDIATYLNDEVKQKSNTSNFMFKIDKIIEFISQSISLKAGDIISTGTPEGVGPMEKGDVVKITIENIGTLTNIVE